jgi:hypothetical protein
MLDGTRTRSKAATPLAASKEAAPGKRTMSAAGRAAIVAAFWRSVGRVRRRLRSAVKTAAPASSLVCLDSLMAIPALGLIRLFLTVILAEFQHESSALPLVWCLDAFS